MTQYFVGPGGNNANNGTSWALRRLTITSGLTLLSAASQDQLIIGPGTYREAPNFNVSGGSVYSTGTVSVTNGSAVVTGSGTSWNANAFANGQFQCQVLAHGTDGVTNGTATFTSSAGNFQAGHVGMTIRIGTKSGYVISAVASATSITLANPDGTAPSPSAASGLTYDVGPESPYEILSVDSNTQITLKQVWSGPSFTGLAYQVWKDIKIIGDEGGTLTDGIGGEIRTTGSDNDQSAARANAASITANYITIRGIRFDVTSSTIVSLASNGTNVIIEDCKFSDGGSNATYFTTTGTAQIGITLRRCIFWNMSTIGIQFIHSATVDNAANLVENCLFVAGPSGGGAVRTDRIGGVLVRNCYIVGGAQGVRVVNALSVGQATTVNNCVVVGCGTGLIATTVAEFIEQKNDLWGNVTARQNVTADANSKAYPPLQQLPLLTLGLMTWIPFYLDSQSQLGSIAGLNPPTNDMWHVLRAATSSWGPAQYTASQRPIDSVARDRQR